MFKIVILYEDLWQKTRSLSLQLRFPFCHFYTFKRHSTTRFLLISLLILITGRLFDGVNSFDLYFVEIKELNGYHSKAREFPSVELELVERVT